VSLDSRLPFGCCRGERYFEVDVDISSSYAAAGVVNIVKGATRGMVIDFGVLIEGQVRHKADVGLVIEGQVRTVCGGLSMVVRKRSLGVRRMSFGGWLPGACRLLQRFRNGSAKPKARYQMYRFHLFVLLRRHRMSCRSC